MDRYRIKLREQAMDRYRIKLREQAIARYRTEGGPLQTFAKKFAGERKAMQPLLRLNWQTVKKWLQRGK